ncbi:MAG: hypothetical protein JO053_14395 [Acidobacteria bacterium]|nr:hypothetical protein [Acidobacteriota bacterium]
MLVLANIWGLVYAVFGWLWRHKPVLIAVAIGVLLVFVAFWWSFCKPSRLEKRIEERDPVIIQQEQAANDAVNAAKTANQAAANALQRANEAGQRANTIRSNASTNVSIDEANRNRCLAYPERCK